MDTRTAEERSRAQERTWAMLCHLSALSGMLGVPMGQLLGPVIVWLIKKDEFEAVDRHGRDVINFQLSFTLYSLGVLVLLAILAGLVWWSGGLEEMPMFFPVLAVMGVVGLLWAFALICTILASIRAYEGGEFRYPFAIRFLR